MRSPSPNGSKDTIKRLLRQKKTLVREIETAWNRKVPKQMASGHMWPLLSSLVVDHAEVLPEPLVAALHGICDRGSFAEYISLSSIWRDPQKYGSHGSFFAAQVLLNLYRKFPVQSEGLDPMAKAVERFYDAEKRCRITNRRLEHYRRFDFSGGRPAMQSLPVHKIFDLARKKIQRWLGPVDLEEILSSVRHGPGGCVGVSRPFSTPYYKFSTMHYTVSTGAYWLGARAIASSDTWVRALAGPSLPSGMMPCVPYETRIRLADTRLTIAEENEVTFVPKDATTHRAIAIEPMMNVMVQLAVGGVMKRALQRAGCDLTDQTRNQALALEGSKSDGSYDPVTIDLEMASDTVSIEVVRELLPSDWFEILDALRSRFGQLPQGKGTIEWAKFSSMGNGFTFELESLIFYALAQAASDLEGVTEWFGDTFGPTYRYGQVSVFGDDIIVPQKCAHLLLRVLRFCGFRANEKKSYLSGPFRESCGADYYNGIPVRPFFFKRTGSLVRDYVHLRNGLRWLMTNPLSRVSKETLAMADSWIPDVLTHHLVGTEPTIGDSYVWVEPDEAHRSALVSWDTDLQSWYMPTMRPKVVVYRGNAEMRLVQFLYVNTGTRPPLVNDDWEAHRVAPLLFHKKGGGSAGDVVRSGQTPGVLSLAGGNAIHPEV